MVKNVKPTWIVIRVLQEKNTVVSVKEMTKKIFNNVLNVLLNIKHQLLAIMTKVLFITAYV
jgi:hypothetical protein